MLCNDSFNDIFYNDTAPSEIYTLSLHDALPISSSGPRTPRRPPSPGARSSRTPNGPPASSSPARTRSEEHTSELQSRGHLVCRLLLEKKKIKKKKTKINIKRERKCMTLVTDRKTT